MWHHLLGMMQFKLQMEMQQAIKFMAEPPVVILLAEDLKR